SSQFRAEQAAGAETLTLAPFTFDLRGSVVSERYSSERYVLLIANRHVSDQVVTREATAAETHHEICQDRLYWRRRLGHRRADAVLLARQPDRTSVSSRGTAHIVLDICEHSGIGGTLS